MLKEGIAVDSIIDLCVGHWAEIVPIDHPSLREQLIHQQCANDTEYSEHERPAENVAPTSTDIEED